jgi:PAS domain S-box-containing protein
MIGYSDRSGRLRYANRHLRAMSGTAEARGRPVREVIGEDVYAVAEPWLRRAYAGETVTYEREAIVDGRARHQEVTYVPDLAGDGAVRGIYSLTYDVTERVQRRAAIRASEARLRGVIAAMAEGLIVQDRSGQIVDANAAAEAMLGLRREQLLGRSSVAQQWLTIREDGSPFPPDEHPAMVTLRTGRPQWNVLMGVHCTRGLRWISVNSQPVAGGDAPADPAVVTTFADVTDERQAFDRIRALAQRLETVREDERRSVAQLLHEGIAQDLFAMQLMLKPYAEPGPGREQVTQLYQAVNASLGKCMAELREIANVLHPTALLHQRLGDAIGSYARYFAELSGLRVQVREGDSFPMLTEPQRVLFFRAAQEGLTNIARHAAAGTVTISLQVDGTTVAMEVCDDGVGIDESAPPKPGSLGLLALKERFHAIGGGARLSRNAGSGCTLRVHAPLAA